MSIPEPKPHQTNHYMTVPSWYHSKTEGCPDYGDTGISYNSSYSENTWGRLFIFVRGFLDQGKFQRKDPNKVSLLTDRFFRHNQASMGDLALEVQGNISANKYTIDGFDPQHYSSYFDSDGKVLSSYKAYDQTLLMGSTEPYIPPKELALDTKKKISILSALSKREPELRKTLESVLPRNRKFAILLVDKNFFLTHFSPIIPTGVFPRLADLFPSKEAASRNPKLQTISTIGRVILGLCLPFAGIEYGVRVLAEKLHVLYVRHTAGEDEAELVKVRHRVNQWAPIAASLNYQAIG